MQENKAFFKVIDRTETAMTQEHAFAAALSIEAQRVAIDLSPKGHR